MFGRVTGISPGNIVDRVSLNVSCLFIQEVGCENAPSIKTCEACDFLNVLVG